MPDLSMLRELGPVIASAIRVPAILVAAWLFTRLLRVLFRRVRLALVERMKPHFRGLDIELEKRAETVGGILRKSAIAGVWLLAGMMTLRELGFEIGPILAGAGIAGLAFGFGAQNLVRDIISGLFMISENQIRINDVAIINGTGGLVEQVNLRTTVLRGLNGTVHIFPNGAITSLSNMTREYSFYVFDMGVAYKEDTDRVAAVMQEVAAELQADPAYAPHILAPLEVLGVDQFADSAVIIKARIKTEPIKQWYVGRELNRRFKKRFDELGIEIPFPHRTLYMGEASPPFALSGPAPDRETIRAVVRELLAEQAAAGRTPRPPGQQ